MSKMGGAPIPNGWPWGPSRPPSPVSSPGMRAVRMFSEFPSPDLSGQLSDQEPPRFPIGGPAGAFATIYGLNIR